MALISKTTIMLAGKEYLNFKEIRLHQKIHAHHFLEARFPWQVLEEDRKELGNKSKEFLGETFSIQITTKFNNGKLGELVFNGIVTGVNIIKVADTQVGDEIVLTVSSPEILIDGGPAFDQYIENDIGSIVKSKLDGVDLKLIKSKVNNAFQENIDYVVQHNESDFEFIQRLSEQYGEWFYYNGEELIFGKPETTGVELAYKIDLTEYKLNLVPQPYPSLYFSNDYFSEGSLKEFPSDPTVSGMNTTVFKKSENVFKSESQVWANGNNEPAGESKLKHKAKVQQEGIAINMVRISGSSKNPGVALGKIVKIDSVDYRVIQVDHFVNRSGHYENQFTGVSANQNGYPHTNVNAFPYSQSQIGVVADNNDPEALGRIKVILPTTEVMGSGIVFETPWLRMSTPHAGGDKGFYCIPEVGEEVIVDFEGGDAESPYVLGSLWNGRDKPPVSNSNNDIKVFQTRSGCSMTFDDADGSITLKDKSGSSISLDGSGNISITASSGEVSINGPKEVSLMSDDEVSLNGKQEVSLKSDNEVSLNGALEVSIESAVAVNIKGLNTTVTGDVTATLEGTMVKVDGTAMTEIKGGIVKMN